MACRPDAPGGDSWPVHDGFCLIPMRGCSKSRPGMRNRRRLSRFLLNRDRRLRSAASRCGREEFTSRFQQKGTVMAIVQGRSAGDNLAEATTILDRWYFSASSGGCLWIESRSSALRLADACILMKRIHKVATPDGWSSIAIHLDRVSVARSIWPLILRLCTTLAQRIGATCRIVQYDSRSRFHRTNEASPQGDHNSGQYLELSGVCILIERVQSQATRLAS